jgi:MerR family transcriptional regulator, light-induced transcriptional regulator
VLRTLSTSEFAEAIGISESSARRLADSGDLKIRRTKGGHRKIPAEEAIRYAREIQATVVRPDLLGLSTNVIDNQPIGADLQSQRLLMALSDGHYAEVIGLMQALYMSGVSIAEMCDGPIRFAMSAIGSAWPQDKRSIFIEHRATILCVRALCQIRLSLPETPENAPSAMGAAPQDDPFLLPSLMASLVLHECGLEEINLGPNTPVDVLADSAEDEKPDVVWLAISNPIRSRTHHREIENLAKVVNSYGGLFLIGGRSATTYTGPLAEKCQSMSEIGLRVVGLSPHSAD